MNLSDVRGCYRNQMLTATQIQPDLYVIRTLTERIAVGLRVLSLRPNRANEQVLKNFGRLDEWQPTCLATGRGIADEHPVSPTYYRSRVSILLDGLCTEPTSLTTRRCAARYACCSYGVFTTSSRHPIVSHPRFQRRPRRGGTQSVPPEWQRC